ncbi:MAG: cytidylate kinase-like family protein [Lachnospiraceae bacterium]|nr:cytidylate kinase-like family protein [Lachnospiraceae bacterium]
MSRVITISREFGSGGREIGFRLAKKLGIPFYDKEVISMASEDSNISEEFFHANDEVVGRIKRSQNDYATVDPFSPVYEIPVSDQLFVIQSKIIKRLTQQGPCVIIGRCSDIVAETPFQVFICASLKKRVERLMSLEKEDGITKKQMEARIRSIDAKRRDYYQYYTGNEWGKPKNYHLCLNSGKLGIEACINLIAASIPLAN